MLLALTSAHEESRQYEAQEWQRNLRWISQQAHGGEERPRFGYHRVTEEVVDTAGTSDFQHLLRHQYAGYLPYNSGRKVATAI